ncbi:MAG: trypsin-like peptidase domain-containing protein [Candidatus Marinimicrobia bacterium]|nr:trypsin-like peptidase domain-containing protein [Candidatus Neomarinimicrobiota bacterium]
MRADLTTAEQLMYSTVRIECPIDKDTSSSGSGFIFHFAQEGEMRVPAIVTNKHVVRDMTHGFFYMHLASETEGMPSSESARIEVPDFEKMWVFHPDPKIDLCILPIAPLLVQFRDKGTPLFYLALERNLIPNEEELAELTALEDVVMIGYPNGIWDSLNNMPIFRKGITATHPAVDYEGRSEFMIDMACFPGSSGSPVLLYNVGGYRSRAGTYMMGQDRIKLLGVLYAGPQHTAEGDVKIVEVPVGRQAVAISRIPNNLGLIIKAKNLFAFDEILKLRDQKLKKRLKNPHS